MAKKQSPTLSVEALKHDDTRKNIPTAELQSVMGEEDQKPCQVRYQRNRDLDPQLMWRGKDEQDWSDLVVPAPPLYIQEKVHPKHLIDNLLRQSTAPRSDFGQVDLFADFDLVARDADKTEFYRHDQNWSNRMILGDSLQVMASLAEREGLRGKVQCIYFDPPYGIKFNSNFQWSTTSRDVKDGNAAHITREPEQVKAFRDTWRDGIHSYLTYLRDRLTVARDLLADSGSIFVQIGDENVHRVRALMDEVFGDENFVSVIASSKTGGQTAQMLAGVADFILWYSKQKDSAKFRRLLQVKKFGGEGADKYRLAQDENGVRLPISSFPDFDPTSPGYRVYRKDTLTSQRPPGDFPVPFRGKETRPRSNYWKTHLEGMIRLDRASRIEPEGTGLAYVRFLDDFGAFEYTNIWTDIGGIQSRSDPKIYVVQSPAMLIQRCLLMATDPGDLVLDPTCGSGTSAYVAEQWGRRWITIDTSRVALALARARIMGARYPYYLLADSSAGQVKEAEITRAAPSTKPTRNNIRHGFVYERVPHITLKSIANNAEIDVIWEKWQETLESLRQQLNTALKESWEDWEIPREAETSWSANAKKLHADWWKARIERQNEIDASIAAKAEFEYLYDKPYQDRKTVRVAGPFTVESLSPHRMLGVDENDELIEQVAEPDADYIARQTFPQMILENLRSAGVQQAHKEDRIAFTSVRAWPGERGVCGEGRYLEGDVEKRAAIFIGPEFGTVQRVDLVEAAREAADAGFDVLIACAFNYEAHTTEFSKLGKLPILKARMNADLHMADNLKNTGKGNLFVVFGEPDIELLTEHDGRYRVRVHGVDVFKPQTGEVISDNADGIACWFLDTDYNGESFFVRHAYFLGANDPYSALRTTLKAEVDPEVWSSLHSDTSRPFEKPVNNRVAVKVINHLGDEVMKVFRIY